MTQHLETFIPQKASRISAGDLPEWNFSFPMLQSRECSLCGFLISSLLWLTPEGNFSVQFDKTLCAMRQTAGKMFPRIAKCIIYHALHHLFATFKMLLQYLELEIIHVGVINTVENPTNGRKLRLICRHVWTESIRSNYLGCSSPRQCRWKKWKL